MLASREVTQETSFPATSALRRGADLSPDKVFRYSLWRQWDKSRPVQLWLLLNPSTGDAVQDDPTVTRIMARSNTLGAGGILICNLYAYRATNPQALRKAHFPVGPDNDRFLDYAIKGYATHPQIMAGWGHHGHMSLREKAIVELVTKTHQRDLWCLGTTMDGAPRHPLYVAYDVQPQLWRAA